MLTTIVTALVILTILGFCTWLVITYVPMPEPFKRAIIVIVVLLLVLWLLAQFFNVRVL